MSASARASKLPSAEAREGAHALVHQIVERAPDLLELGGVDLSGALEQQLFFVLRDGIPPASGLARIVSDAKRAARTALGIAAPLGGILANVRSGAIAVLVREPIHLEALELIDRELGDRFDLTVIRVGRAGTAPIDRFPSARLSTLIQPPDALALAAHATRVAARWPRATRSWLPSDLRPVGRDALALVALGAAALAGLARRRPSLIVGFDEVGTLARLTGAAGRRYRIPTLDLPHAEASDPSAIRGADYDRMAVYGPRATAALVQAGIPRQRIVEIGAPRFDPLVRARAPRAGDGGPRRVVFAAQYVTGQMTGDALEMTLRGAVAAAAAIGPAELIVRPHPAEPPGQIAAMARGVRVPDGVTLRIEPVITLHALLDDAWLLVTGWSNSLFEAALRGVPAIAMDPQGRSPINYAAEGLAVPANDDASMAGAALSLVDDAARAAALDRARAALTTHLGPLDGRASARAAALMEEMASGAGADR